jgi:hypothetical protein
LAESGQNTVSSGNQTWQWEMVKKCHGKAINKWWIAHAMLQDSVLNRHENYI